MTEEEIKKFAHEIYKGLIEELEQSESEGDKGVAK